MLYQITDAADFALSILRDHRSGTVHSVYRKTVNLSFGGQLIAVQSAGSPLSPISLLCSLSDAQLNSLPIQAGQSVFVSDAGLCLSASGSIVFAMDAVRSHRCALNVLPEQNAAEILIQSVRSVVMRSTVSGFAQLVQNSPAVSSDLILSAAARIIEQARRQLSDGLPEQAAETLCGVLGLGIGLTPSGDDFLCGILAGFILRGQENTRFACALRRRVADSLSRTNEISAAFLSCALNGQFSQAVCSLPQLPNERQIEKRFSAIGHSSGIDTLCGVLFALTEHI